MVNNYEGQIFVLSNSDLFFICKDAAIEDIDAAIMKVRYLFSEDPLSQGDEEEDLARFCTWYNVQSQFDELLDMVKSMHRERERKARLAVASEKGSQPNKGSRKDLDPEQLGTLENLDRESKRMKHS